MLELWEKTFNQNYYISSIGRVMNKKTGHILIPEITCFGYPRVTFGRKHYHIHKLVAQAFIPNPLNKPCVNHINGIKTDNNVNNLEWATYKENNDHAKRVGLLKVKPKIEKIKKKTKRKKLRKKVKKIAKKRVALLLINGDVIKIFDNIDKASKYSKLSVGCIQQRIKKCKHKRHNTEMFKWVYLD